MAYVAFGLLGGNVFGDAGVLAGSAEAGMEVGEQRRVARNMSCVEQRGADGGVLCAFDQAILDGARGVTDLHAEIPQEIQHVLDHAQRLLRGFRAGEEQQVDIAERRQHATAISAGGGDREVVRLA